MNLLVQADPHYHKFYVSRQKLSLRGDNKALKDEDTLADLKIGDGAELAIKDLGPQVSWTTTFIVEYVSIESQPSFHVLSLIT
jgi:hypothetical protein